MITSVPDIVTITEIVFPENAAIFTDHSVVFYELNVFAKTPAKTNRYLYDYEKGDFDGLRSALSATNLCSNLERDDINNDWQSWKNIFLQTVLKHVPRKKIKGRKPLPWITGNILNLIKKKNTVRRKLKSCPTSHLAQKFKELRTAVKKVLRESRENYFTSLGNNFKQNPKRLWSILSNKSKSHNIPNIVSSTVNSINNEDNPVRLTADNPIDIANIFNRYFTSVYTASDNHEDTDHEQVEPAVITELALSVEEVQAVLGSLDSTKATGPDGIPARLLKETASVISPSLCKLYNKSLDHGIFPQDWKLANIVPIYKKGQREHTENYRPISLLPIVSKVLERCVFFNIKDHLFQLIQNSQHGFISGKSCITNLLEVLDYIGSELDNGGQVDAIYLDLSKAFDKVNHSRLKQKLRMAGFGGKLIQWFNSYLTNRKQRVTVLGATSTTLPVTSGVPQGSILGPVLFTLYVNDLPDAVKFGQIAMFADDTKLFSTVRTENDCKNLQNDLDSLQVWSSASGLSFNDKKCKAQHITRKITPKITIYKLSSNLEQIESERDLGVWVQNNLSWNKQVDCQSAKANKLLGYIRRSTLYIHNTAVRRILYLTLVRPHLGYATQIWSPQSVLQIQQIERTQRRATKFILELSFTSTTDYTTRLQTLSLLPICYWHEYLDMVLFYKITNGLVSLKGPFTRAIFAAMSTAIFSF